MSEHHAHARDLADRLGRYRRRLRRALFLRQMPTVFAAALIASAAVTIAGATTRGVLIGATATVAVAIAASAIAALVRTPSLQGTARIVDSAFGLADATVTALQFSTADDSVSQLVVAHASERLAAHTPDQLPLTPSARVHWSAPVVVGSVFLVAALAWSSSNRTDPESSDGMSGAPAGQASSESRQPSHSAALRASAPGQANGSAQEPSSSTDPRQTSRDGRDRATASRTQIDPNRGQAEHDGQNSTAAASAPARAAADVAGAGNTNKVGENQTGNGRRSGGSGVDRAGTGGSAGSGGAPDGRAAGAGGVDASSPAMDQRTNQPRARRAASYASEYPLAAARAEAAIADARVPAEFRALVRDYFLAIRPASGR